MSSRRIRVVVNGYGVIGKRIADAVALQDDMELAGVVDVVSDWRIKVAAAKGYPVYAATTQSGGEMRAAGIPVAALQAGFGPEQRDSLLARRPSFGQRQAGHQRKCFARRKGQ